MRVRGWLTGLVLSSFLSLPAAAEPALLDWLGQDPFQKREDMTLFELPVVAAELARLQWSIQRPDLLRAPLKVGQRDSLVIVTLCERRQCADRNWALLIDQESGEIGLCDYSAKVSSSAMSYSLTLTRSYLSAKVTMSGVLSQSLPNGCLDPEGESLARLWSAARTLLN